MIGMSLSSDCTHVLHTYYVAQTPNIPTLHSNAYLLYITIPLSGDGIDTVPTSRGPEAREYLCSRYMHYLVWGSWSYH